MVCVYCGTKTQTINSRHLKRNNSTWRRRKCLKCGAIFTTNEEAMYSSLVSIQKPSSKALDAFNRDNLYLSIYDSLRHRKMAINEASDLTETVISKLINKNNKALINLDLIKSIVYETLNNFDKTAAVHYKAYYD